MPTPNYIESVLKSFDEQMHKFICNCKIDEIQNCPRTEVIKSFLSTALEKQQKEFIEKIEGMKVIEPHDSEKYPRATSYNQALEDLKLSLLKE